MMNLLTTQFVSILSQLHNVCTPTISQFKTTGLPYSDKCLGNGKCWTIFPIDNDEHLLNIFISYLQTALHWAAKKGRNDLVEILTNTEMDVNLKSVSHQFLCVNNVPISFFLMHKFENLTKTFFSFFYNSSTLILDLPTIGQKVSRILTVRFSNLA